MRHPIDADSGRLRPCAAARGAGRVGRRCTRHPPLPLLGLARSPRLCPPMPSATTHSDCSRASRKASSLILRTWPTSLAAQENQRGMGGRSGAAMDMAVGAEKSGAASEPAVAGAFDGVPERTARRSGEGHGWKRDRPAGEAV